MAQARAKGAASLREGEESRQKSQNLPATTNPHLPPPVPVNGPLPPAQHTPRPMPATFSDVLAVLAPPAGAHGVGEGVFGFLGMGAARPLRLVSKVVVSPWAHATRPTKSLPYFTHPPPIDPN